MCDATYLYSAHPKPYHLLPELSKNDRVVRREGNWRRRRASSAGATPIAREGRRKKERSSNQTCALRFYVKIPPPASPPQIGSFAIAGVDLNPAPLIRVGRSTDVRSSVRVSWVALVSRICIHV
ncbi:hypothetical protein NL676_016734 [Syzygium grande]|nr:hypothetical protein NL676_016734 [Syzygium grande]